MKNYLCKNSIVFGYNEIKNFGIITLLAQLHNNNWDSVVKLICAFMIKDANYLYC